jgi:hypothetical protein
MQVELSKIKEHKYEIQERLTVEKMEEVIIRGAHGASKTATLFSFLS